MNAKIYYVLFVCLMLATAVACIGSGSGEQPVPIEEVEEAPAEEAPVEEPAVEEPAESASIIYTQDGNPCIRDVLYVEFILPITGGGGGQKVAFFDIDEDSDAVITKIPQEKAVDQAFFAGPDGRFIAMFSSGEEIRIWDANKEEEIARLQRESRLRRPVVNREKGLLAAADGEDKVWLWDLNRLDGDNGKMIVDLDVAGTDWSQVQQIALSPDGKSLVSSEQGQVWLWPTAEIGKANGALAVDLGDIQDGPFALSNDGKLLAVVETNQNEKDGLWRNWGLVHVFDIIDGKKIDEIWRLEGEIVSEQEIDESAEGPTYQLEDLAKRAKMKNGHAAPIDWLAFSPDSKVLYTSSGTDGTIRMWDISTGEHLRCFEGIVENPTISADGYKIAATLGGSIAIWDVTTSQFYRRFGLQSELGLFIDSIIYSPDGTKLFTIISEEQATRIWDIETGRFVGLLRHPAHVATADISPDGRRILTGIADRSWDEDGNYSESGAAWIWDADHSAVRLAAAAQALVDEGLEAGWQGDSERMLLAFEEAQQLAPDDGVLLRPSIWQRACRLGSLAGKAAEMLEICDRAIAGAIAASYDNEIPADYYDSRGIARALGGDYQGAIDDLQTYVDAVYGDELRESWIEALSNGENPFDETTLKALRSE